MNLVLIALATAAISMTITKSSLFKRLPLYCPYCLSHWVAFAFVLNCYDFEIINFIIRAFAVITLASFFGIFINYFLVVVDE